MPLLGHFLFGPINLKVIPTAVWGQAPQIFGSVLGGENLCCVAHLLGHFLFWPKYFEVVPTGKCGNRHIDTGGRNAAHMPTITKYPN